MGKIVSEKSGTRRFERIGRWSALDYSIIARSSRFAEYADNYNSDDKKLNITWFRHGNVYEPLNKYVKLDSPVKLEELSTLSMRSKDEDDIWLEVSSDGTKVRLYKEVQR